MHQSHDLKPNSPEFQRELIELLAQICRSLLKKQREAQESDIRLVTQNFEGKFDKSN